MRPRKTGIDGDDAALVADSPLSKRFGSCGKCRRLDVVCASRCEIDSRQTDVLHEPTFRFAGVHQVDKIFTNREMLRTVMLLAFLPKEDCPLEIRYA